MDCLLNQNKDNNVSRTAAGRRFRRISEKQRLHAAVHDSEKVQSSPLSLLFLGTTGDGGGVTTSPALQKQNLIP